MKTKKIFVLVSCFAALNLGAQNIETVQEISTPVKSAIIYLYGAEVAHVKQINVTAGRNKIVFTGLSPKLNSKSIQVNTTGDVSILAISDAINYLAVQKESAKIKQLKDSVKLLKEAISGLNSEKDAIVSEKTMLIKNQEIGGTDKGVDIAQLKIMDDFFRNKLKEINSEVLKLDQKINQCVELQINCNNQLNELNAKNNQPTAEITILLSAATKTTTTIDLKYIVSDAGWAASYDLLGEDITQPIVLKYRAKVFNNTGIDWNDIKIKLSTSDPSQSAAKPLLSAWNLNYNLRNQYDYLTNGEGYMGNKLQEVVITASKNEMDKDNNEITTQPQISNGTFATPLQQGTAGQPIKFEEIQVSELSAEFEIKNSYTIPSDSKPYIVDVTEYKLPANYQHFSVPKLDRDAFLLARITGWEDLDLVEGPANVYYGGTYVGQSYIYTRSVDDTLDLSLGRDNKVLVTRSKIKEYCTKKVFGNNTKETFAYEMVVKNNRKTPVQIDIEDQLPISNQSDIVVEALETSKAMVDSKTGKLTWSYNLQPGDIKKITLSYSVKYPKASSVNLKQTKRKIMAKF